jgi:hypothetical protein
LTTKFASVFTGEAMAVLKTLEIISESQGESFERSLKKAMLSLKIKEELLALKKHKKDIKFVWIPTHMGIVLNEIANASAKESIQKGENAQYLILVTDLKTKLRVAAEKWNRESRKQKGRKYFENYYQTNRKSWFQEFKF